MQTFTKDPDATLDYTQDWSAWLGADTITNSTWSSDTGLTIDTHSFTTTVTTVWLSGGTSRGYYIVTNHITTAAGRKDDRSIKIKVADL